jgi:hypothetical protein
MPQTVHHPLTPRASPRSLGSLQEEVDPAFHIGVAILVEMQFGNVAQAETARQFVTEIMPRVFECRHGRLLLALFAAAAASALALVQTKLAPGESTDGAVFFPDGRQAAGHRSPGGADEH